MLCCAGMLPVLCCWPSALYWPQLHSMSRALIPDQAPKMEHGLCSWGHVTILGETVGILSAKRVNYMHSSSCNH